MCVFVLKAQIFKLAEAVPTGSKNKAGFSKMQKNEYFIAGTFYSKAKTSVVVQFAFIN